MEPSSKEQKVRLRDEVRERLRALKEQSRQEGSAQACALLAGQATWQQAAAVLMYAPQAGELNVWPLLAEALKSGKQVCLPRYDAAAGQYCASEIKDLEADVEPGRYGIREPSAGCAPVALNRLDLILVPGVAFDRHGHRLGRGKGFYDRLLAAVRGKTCGVAFDEQIVRIVPVEPHDSDVNCILTPTRWIEL